MLRPGASRAALMDGISPLVQFNFLTNPTLPSWLTLSRAGNAMVFDSSGALTYAPNNLLLRSQEYGGTSWTGLGGAAVTGTTTDPNGAGSVNIVTANGGNGFYQASLSFLAGAKYILSGYVKSISAGDIQLIVGNQAFGGGGDRSLRVNGQTGAFVSKSAEFTSYTIEAAGNSYWRISATFTATATATAAIAVYGIAIGQQYVATWLQLEAVTYQTTPRAYNATTSAAYYGPRFDNAPAVASSPRGFLIEEARTNSIRNSTMQGGVTGSPGTAPNNWAINNIGTLTQTLAFGTEFGMPYVDLRLNGTTSTTNIQINFEGGTAIAAASGQTWTSSFYARVSAGSQANISGFSNVIVERNSGGSALASTGAALTLSSSLERKSFAKTLNQATTAFVNTQLQISTSSGVAIDITLRIYQPQLEQGAFASSPIPTFGAAATRAADIAYATFPQLSLSSGALIVEATPMAIIGNGTFAEGVASVAGALAGLTLTQDTTGRGRVIVRHGTNRFDTLNSAMLITAAAPYRMGGSWGNRPNAASMGTLHSSFATPAQQNWASPGIIYLGMRGQGAGSLWGNIWLRSLALYPAPLNDNDLILRTVVGAAY
jgi:hypothetical protein